jgi:hypothetical protein
MLSLGLISMYSSDSFVALGFSILNALITDLFPDQRVRDGKFIVSNIVRN